MNAKLLAVALLAATGAAVAVYPTLPLGDAIAHTEPPPVISPSHKAVVEVVFVLDTTGSMSGLIEAAKEKIWSIATTLASGQPAPEIRMGLVAYRDRGDAYVTQVTDLSTDLDSMYAQLMDFRADGGGDGPEAVNQALYDAVHRMSWSQGTSSYKVVFLVGDAPPHMDYPDDVPYGETLKAATGRGIVVNTIQAGQDPETRRDWQHIASLNQGRYFQVGSHGNTVAVATPFDNRIAELSAALDRTRVYYGTPEELAEKAEKMAATEKLHAGASIASQARRGAFNASSAGAANFLGDKELVDDVASGRVDLDSVPASALPAPVQALAPEARQEAIDALAAERKALGSELAELAQQRQAFIESEVDEAAVGDSLDVQVYEAIRAQAAGKGMRYEDGPTY